jgi:hypothetical protein
MEIETVARQRHGPQRGRARRVKGVCVQRDRERVGLETLGLVARVIATVGGVGGGGGGGGGGARSLFGGGGGGGGAKSLFGVAFRRVHVHGCGDDTGDDEREEEHAGAETHRFSVGGGGGGRRKGCE